MNAERRHELRIGFKKLRAMHWSFFALIPAAQSLDALSVLAVCPAGTQ